MWAVCLCHEESPLVVAVLGLCRSCRSVLSLVVVCRDFSSGSMRAFPIAVQGLYNCSAQSSVVLVPRFHWPAICGISVPGPGIEPASPALEGRFLTTGPPGKSLESSFAGTICGPGAGTNISHALAVSSSQHLWGGMSSSPLPGLLSQRLKEGTSKHPRHPETDSQCRW